MDDKSLLAWLEFVATKFASSQDGWKYTTDKGDLDYIRFKSDTTGYRSFFSRLKRAFTPRLMFPVTGFRAEIRKRSGSSYPWHHVLVEAWAWVVVSMRKDKHSPDGVVNGGNIITFWEEDGEYITLMGPSVGVKVIEFLRAEPDNPHSKAILAEMRRMASLSWPEEVDLGQPRKVNCPHLN